MADALVTQVLIIGGGIGGLTLGAILRKLNISYLVLERGSNAQPVGAGISLAPNCLRVLDQLGLYGDLQREAQEVKKILIHHEQTEWRELSFAPVAENFAYPVYAAERQFCSDLLYAAANGAETVLHNARVIEVDDDPALPFVSVTTADGRRFQAEVVVGADGIRSVTRRLLARKAGMTGANTIQFTGRVHMSGYTAPLPNLGEQELGVGNWLFYDDNVVLTTWPCKDNRQWFICVQRAENAQNTSSDRSTWNNVTPNLISDAFGSRFHPFASNGRFEEIVGHSQRVVATDVYHEVEFPTMAQGRVALLGDAAHSMTSFFGQGACQAIEDATELANSLHSYFTNKNELALERVLDDYSQRRSERAKAVANFSSMYARVHMANLPYGLGPLARRLVFGYLPESGWMHALRWLYGYQPTVDALPQESDKEGSFPNLYRPSGDNRN